MSVLGTISLSGLSTTNSDYILCGELEVTTLLKVDPGGSVLLPPGSINDTALSSNVAFKNANNTFTGVNTFNTNQATFNAGLISNNTMYSQGGAGSTLWQFTDTSNATTGDFILNNNLFYIKGGGNNASIIFQLKDTGGTLQNMFTLNYNQPTLLCTNPLTCTATMPVATDSSTKMPTTAWVQSAITNTLTGLGSVFFLSANNTATGQNNFQNSGSNIPLTISTSSVANYVGNHFVSSGAGSYNPIVQPNEYVIVGRNTATLGAGTLTLTTHSGTSGGIKIFGNGNSQTYGTHTFNSYIIPSTVSSPGFNSASLGHSYGQTATSFNPLWTGQPPNQNIYTLNITASGSPIVYGTYLVNTCIYFYSSGFPTTLAVNWNQTSATTLTSPNMSSVSNQQFFQDPPGTGFYYACVNFSFTTYVYGATTWYLNGFRTGGIAPQGFVTSAYFSWTRIA